MKPSAQESRDAAGLLARALSSFGIDGLSILRNDPDKGDPPTFDVMLANRTSVEITEEDLDTAMEQEKAKVAL